MKTRLRFQSLFWWMLVLNCPLASVGPSGFCVSILVLVDVGLKHSKTLKL